MGMYVNPGNAAFQRIAGPNYVDKTGMIALMNERIGGEESLVCISRPRRFGKSWAAMMLAAYYDCTCDSHELFDHRNIARTKNYKMHLNQYNVISLDITSFISEVQEKGGSLREVPGNIKKAVWKDLIESGFLPREEDTLNEFLLRCVEQSDGRPFIFIIDEWDAMIRETEKDEETQMAYLSLLRGWFKNNSFTPKAVAAAYMTGILPIKKNGSQSAISDFHEYSILQPGNFAKYTGFTESEVIRICRKKRMPFEEVKSWYDGYELSGKLAIYNPYSVMKAMDLKSCQSFWGKTSAAEGLTTYIQRNYEGLQETIASLIAGMDTEVNTDTFQNDLETFHSRDDILTLLIHLGYLTYDAERRTARIPNEELRLEFKNFLGNDDVGNQWNRLITRSNRILEDTIQGREDDVAAALEEIRQEQYAPQYYNNEQSLRAVIKYAYLSAVGKYVHVQEMPSGKGIADIVFLPASLKKLPAMVVELKWNKSAGGAIEQIREKHYTAALKPFEGNIILCGINYDTKTGKHTCKIEKA